MIFTTYIFRQKDLTKFAIFAMLMLENPYSPVGFLYKTSIFECPRRRGPYSGPSENFILISSLGNKEEKWVESSKLP